MTSLDRRRALAWAATGLAGSTLSHPALAAETPLVVAQIGPFTGIPVPDAPQINLGIKAGLAQANAAGGVQGRPLQLLEFDDGYTAEGFVTQFAEALKRKPLALLSPIGSVALKRMLQDKLLDSADVVVLNALPGAELLRSPGHPKLFHIRAGDRQQIERMVRHAHGVGIRKLAVLHQDIPIGTSGLAMAQAMAGQLDGLSLMPAVATADTESLKAAVDKLALQQPQGVLVLGAPRFMADGIAMLRRSGLHQFVFALSYVPPMLINQLVGGAARGVGLAQTYPNPNGITLTLQRDFQAAMRAIQAPAGPYSAFHFEGYITARVLVEALRRTRDLSPAGLARSLRAMGEIDLGGFRVNFSKDNVGSSFVDVGVINGDGRLVY